MPINLESRLNLARHYRFVGREAELDRFRSALLQDYWPYCLLYVYGLPGIGKTALLHEFKYLAEESAVAAVYLDAGRIQPDAEEFLSALRRSIELRTALPDIDALSSYSERFLLLIDSYETLAPLDSWFRNFLTQLPEQVLVVLASTNPPSPAWQAEFGWQTVIRALHLDNFTPEESEHFLEQHRVPPEQHQSILEFTHGHPLALSLVVDVFAQRAHYTFRTENHSDIIKNLLQRFLRNVPGPAHRAALEACAIARVTNEPLLAAMLQMPSPGMRFGSGVYELFDWLQSLTFIDTSIDGLSPHPLIRQVLTADLRWRNPSWYTELQHRARAYYLKQFEKPHGNQPQGLVLDLLFLNRDDSTIAPFFTWKIGQDHAVESMQESDVADIVALVAMHEGTESTHLLSHWLNRQPQGVLVSRDHLIGEVSGFMLMLALDETVPEDREIDPAVRGAYDYLQNRAPLRSGEKAYLVRFWLTRDSYQSVSAIQTVFFVNALMYYMVVPQLAYTFFCCAHPEFWAPAFKHLRFDRIVSAHFHVGERSYGIFGHDWRAVPARSWLSLLANYQVRRLADITPAGKEIKPLVVLDRQEFETAVRDLLRDFARPDLLRNNPLVRTRLTAGDNGLNLDENEMVEKLRDQVLRAAQLMRDSPRHSQLYLAVKSSYLEPVGTQEAAAQHLNMPFSTFRRHLKLGIDQITETLWRWDVSP